MNRDVVALTVNLIYIIDMVNLSGKVPRSVNGNIRIVSVDIHAKMDSRICHLYADRAQPDNAKLFALQLTTRKLLLFLFRRRSKFPATPAADASAVTLTADRRSVVLYLVPSLKFLFIFSRLLLLLYMEQSDMTIVIYFLIRKDMLFRSPSEPPLTGSCFM